MTTYLIAVACAVSSLMNTLDGECLYKCKQVACSVVVARLFVYPLFYTLLNALEGEWFYKCKQVACSVVVACLFAFLYTLLLVYFFIHIFILMLLLYIHNWSLQPFS